MVEDKYVGLGLAISGSFLIGSSFIITKKGLIAAAERQPGYASDSYGFLQNVTWWAGMVTMVVGEVANFAAYAFAPPILVTPLGALSVLIGAVLASIFLKEELGRIGRVGCTLCLVGSLIIVLHAPEDKEVASVDEILAYFMQPGFLFYSLCVLIFSLYMIYTVAPRHGTRNPLVYLSICSVVGSVSVMAIKGLGIALKLTFAGNNQLTHLPTYVFGFVTAGCIVVQMHYFNRALDLFSTNVVNPIYYVTFSTATIIASLILFQGVEVETGRDSVSLVAGFVTIFMGVYLLNISRSDPSGVALNSGNAHRNSLIETRMSMQGHPRLSLDERHGQLPLHSRRSGARPSPRTGERSPLAASPPGSSASKRASAIFDGSTEGLPILGDSDDDGGDIGASDDDDDGAPPSYTVNGRRVSGHADGASRDERHPALSGLRAGPKR